MIFLRNKNRQNGTRGNNNNNRVSLNEKLASIGGLFGAISIIITGALLYAIFTAKSEDKWYYVTAVLINISLLLLLMIGAIFFDKYYFKKWANTRTTRQQQNQGPSIISNDPTIFDRTPTNIESQCCDAPLYVADVPQLYPGFYPKHFSNDNLLAANNDLISKKIIIINENKSNLPPDYNQLYPNKAVE